MEHVAGNLLGTRPYAEGKILFLEEEFYDRNVRINCLYWNLADDNPRMLLIFRLGVNR